jgi:molybdopterin-guanine dinucleotide biosynthesis protein A
MPLPAVILAGGLSRRMGGGDKPLLRLHGRPLLAHVVARLAPQAGPLAINANGDPARFSAYGLPVLPDPVLGHPGPLAGILAALLWAKTLGAPAVLTAPGDAPFLPFDLLHGLSEGDLPAIAASRGRPHPVVGLWPVTFEAPLRKTLAQGRLRVLDFALAQGARVVDFPIPDDGREPFLNLNTPQDLAAARLLP